MSNSIVIALHSDLHLERQDWPKGILEQCLCTSKGLTKVIVLAGDIGNINHAGSYLYDILERFQEAYIIYVPGNHESYGVNDLSEAESKLKLRFANNSRVFILQKDSIEINGVRFLGCTLWSDFNCDEGEMINDACLRAEVVIEDFRSIGYENRRFTIEDCRRLSRQHQSWLVEELAKPFNGKTVVVTHFAPSVSLINRRFGSNELTPYFNLDLENIIRQYSPDVWCYGHTHDNYDVKIGDTRVISNQRGYGAECKDSYNPNFIIEI